MWVTDTVRLLETVTAQGETVIRGQFQLGLLLVAVVFLGGILVALVSLR